MSDDKGCGCCPAPQSSEASKLLSQVVRGMLLISAAVVIIAVLQADQLDWATMVTMLIFAAISGSSAIALALHLERGGIPTGALKRVMSNMSLFELPAEKAEREAAKAEAEARAQRIARRAESADSNDSTQRETGDGLYDWAAEPEDIVVDDKEDPAEA